MAADTLDESTNALSEAVFALARRIDVHPLILPAVAFDHAISQYKATIPGRVEFQQGLSLKVRSLAFIHELCHMALHPPDSDDFTTQGYFGEEPSAHQAAHRICEAWGVSAYIELMAASGVPGWILAGWEEDLVGLMVDRVGPALSATDTCPRWAGPVRADIWRHARELATACTAIAEEGPVAVERAVRQEYATLLPVDGVFQPGVPD